MQEYYDICSVLVIFEAVVQLIVNQLIIRSVVEKILWLTEEEVVSKLSAKEFVILLRHFRVISFQSTQMSIISGT